MNEYTQFGDVLASPVTGIKGVAGEIRPAESARQSPRLQGRHRMHRSRRAAAGFRPLRAVAVVVTAGALAAAVFAVGTLHESASQKTAATLTVPQLTKADIRQLEHLTPAEAARFTKDIDTAYGKLGIHAGVGTVSATGARQARLTSYQWAGGVQWDHLWMTASYANLQPIANRLDVVAGVATQFCTKLPGWFAVGCSIVGYLISYFLSKVHVTNWSSSHGIWAAHYWFPFSYNTGGTW